MFNEVAFKNIKQSLQTKFILDLQALQIYVDIVNIFIYICSWWHTLKTHYFIKFELGSNEKKEDESNTVLPIKSIAYNENNIHKYLHTSSKT